MNLLELSRTRYSVRDYISKQIPEESLLYILETGQLAPSAVNYQPWKIYVVEEANNLAKLHQCYPRKWFYNAPICLLICANHAQSWKRPNDGKDHADIDVAILTQQLCLAASEIGIGSCWICNFDTKLCAELFELPDELEPIVILSLGYSPNYPPTNMIEKKRKNFDEIVERR